MVLLLLGFGFFFGSFAPFGVSFSNSLAIFGLLACIHDLCACDFIGIFLVEAGVLGLIGGIIGILLGIGFSKTVEIIATISLGTTLIQASFPWYLILGSLAFSFGVGSLAGTYPAMQASKLPPVEALRQ